MKIRKFLNFQHSIIQVTEERRLKSFGYLERMTSNTIPKMMMEWNTEGRRRKGKPREQWIDGLRRSIISKDLTGEGAEDR